MAYFHCFKCALLNVKQYTCMLFLATLGYGLYIPYLGREGQSLYTVTEKGFLTLAVVWKTLNELC